MTVTIKLEGVDSDFVRKAKTTAYGRGLTFKDFILDAMERALPEDIDARIAALHGDAPAARPPRKGRRR